MAGVRAAAPGADFRMIAVTFAVPQESRDFRRALRRAGGRMGGEEIRVVHLGIGPEAASANAQRLFAEAAPRAMICAGFAGGLAPGVRRGGLVIAENFSAPELLARARSLAGKTPNRFFGALVSQSLPIETAAAKAALAHDSGALAVDMETASVAEICAASGVPLLAIRAISDDAATPLPVPFAHWFDLGRQRPRPLALLRHLALHPRAIAPFASFIRGLAPARAALADFLTRFLAR